MEPVFATSTLIAVLGALVLLSAFFSGSETALMRVNRYRLANQASQGHRGARLAKKLLEKPDQLIGLILLGNNIVNISAPVLAGVIVARLGIHPFSVVVVLTPIIVIFAELAPKTLAALKPESVAYPAAMIYYPLLILLFPFVWIINAIANGLLSMFGVGSEDESLTSLSSEELRVAVNEAGSLLPKTRQTMLLRVLDLDSVTVEDIMIPRADINGIDLEDDWSDIVSQIRTSSFTRIPVYTNEYENVEGILHLRKIVPQLINGDVDIASLKRAMLPAYFVPEDTPLNTQLMNFQNNRHRMALVVDEYGDVQGLITLGDLLEEIVGEFRDDPIADQPVARFQGNGIYQVDGSINIRELNRAMHWDLPTDGPKTLNGLIIEELETIPAPGTKMTLFGYPMKVIHIRDNVVKTINIRPQQKTIKNIESA